MNENKKRSGKRISPVLAVALILLLLVSALTAGAYAKYRSQVIVANEISYSNRLASSFKLLDPEAGATDNGFAASHYLIPGTTIKPSPVLQIEGKTQIPAYVYLEIKGPSSLVRTDYWRPLDGVTGKNGGTIFVYGVDGKDIILINTDTDIVTIPLLAEYQVPFSSAQTPFDVELWGYMIQRNGEETALEAFNRAVAPSVDSGT